MHERTISRRRFLGQAAVGVVAAGIIPTLGLRRAHAAALYGNPGKFLVIVNMLGGNDGINMVAPVGHPSYRSRRPTINLVDNLPPGEVLQDINGTHAFHYRMPGIRQMWLDGDVHIVGKVSYPSPNQSHFTSRDIYSYGVRDYGVAGDGRGWLGRLADLYWSSPTEPLGVISVGLSKLPDFRSDVTSPLILGNVSGFRVDTDTDFPTDHTLRETVARDLLIAEPTPADDLARTILERTRETYPLVDRVQADTATWVNPGTYPTNTIGNNLRTISQLLEAHASWGTQVFYTGFGGFDTHSGQHSSTGGQNLHEALMTSLDDALTAFANDLKARGLWDDCVVVVISEFGRRTFENGSNGTDHGHGGVSLVLGGSVRGQLVTSGYTGQITELDLQANYLPFAHDFRDIYGHVIESHLGLPAASLFPDPSYTPSFGSLDLV